MQETTGMIVGGIVGVLLAALIGLAIGVLAKLLMPGKDPGGWFATILLGIAGSWSPSLSAIGWSPTASTWSSWRMEGTDDRSSGCSKDGPPWKRTGGESPSTGRNGTGPGGSSPFPACGPWILESRSVM